MKPDQIYCILDYETRSEANLKGVGVWEYSVHPSTRVLCVGWRIGTRSELRSTPISSWSPFIDKKAPQELITTLENPKIRKVARNALFEQVITANVLPKHLVDFDPSACADPAVWECTASLAATLALPRSLEGACLALNLPVQKDMAGRRLILKYCKPRKATKNNSDKWHRKLSELKRIIQYCKTDVEADTEFFLAVPSLSPFERAVWILDQRTNLRGIRVDRELVLTTLRLVKQEQKELLKKFQELTGLDSPNQRDKFLRWIKARDGDLPNLRAKTVEDALAEKNSLFIFSKRSNCVRLFLKSL